MEARRKYADELPPLQDMDALQVAGAVLADGRKPVELAGVADASLGAEPCVIR